MMPHEESVSSAAVGFAIKVKAAAIVVFAFSGRATGANQTNQIHLFPRIDVKLTPINSV